MLSLGNGHGKGPQRAKLLRPFMMPGAGLEPASHTAIDFKSIVFTDFTTRARPFNRPFPS